MVQPYGPLLDPAIDVTALGDFRKSLSDRRTQLEAFLPLVSTIEAAKGVATIPATVVATINSLDAAVALLPEPTKQDAAREFLIIGQERLETYRGVASRTKQAEDYATLTATVYDTYADVSTKALEAIYKKVEKEFADLYSHINKDDEEKFTAQLTPSFGKLGFDVDFYGRGFFPPGAYHSEGHQDGMGLCLYLALMRHLLQDDFRFAVLDDVVMSVDSGHRRQVCNLLKEKFPNTQFILTTHDEIWLRHMRSAGLISSKSFVQFKNWNVEEGPTEWTDRDVWQEIEQALKSNDVRRAAGILRHYLEYISAEICDRLRAPVEFRGDAQFQLGDLLPSAVGQFGKLLREGKAAAQSWGQKDKMVTLTTLESDFKKSVEGSKVEQWQVNTAIHYNQWENLQKADFEPVVLAYRALLGHFRCAEATCGALLAVVPERNQRETVRCPCGANDINLVPKS
jgi:FPC/CPF motif-containing protein YcgG